MGPMGPPGPMSKQLCPECALTIMERALQNGGFQINDEQIWDGLTWNTVAQAQVTVAGTSYCLEHGVAAYKITKQYVINE